MIKHHQFIFAPALWMGEGTIKLSLLKEELIFSTKWNTYAQDSSGLIECMQQICVQDVTEPVYNQLIFSDVTLNRFTVEFQSASLGKLMGKGLTTEHKIAWEFKAEDIGFEGLEIYEKVDENRYQMYAEYATQDELRTVIKGVIWQVIS
ncbi:MAG: hypothetical protein QRY71_00375 [Candidatus Rhabdochlamydia sp.]